MIENNMIIKSNIKGDTKNAKINIYLKVNGKNNSNNKY